MLCWKFGQCILSINKLHINFHSKIPLKTHYHYLFKTVLVQVCLRQLRLIIKERLKLDTMIQSLHEVKLKCYLTSIHKALTKCSERMILMKYDHCKARFAEWKKIFTVKLRTVDQSTIQFWTIFGVLLTETCY